MLKKIPLPPKMSKKSNSSSPAKTSKNDKGCTLVTKSNGGASPASTCSEYPLAEMTNEERMQFCVKKLFADRPYKGYFVYRNPSNQQISNSAQVKAPPQQNPIVTSIGSQFFSRPDYQDSKAASSSLALKVNDNSKSASKSQGQRQTKPPFGKGQSGKSAANSPVATKNQK